MATNKILVTHAVVKQMLTKNEVGNTSPYVISDAKKGNSGYSFGQCQWDLSHNSDGQKIFEDILTNAKDADGKNIFTGDEVDKVKEIVEKHGDISSYNDRINQALQSDYGKATIDQKFDAQIDNYINRLDNLISELKAKNGADDPAAAYIEKSPLMQMQLIDYDNQLHIKGIDEPGMTMKDGALMKALKGDKVDDLNDYLKYLFDTGWANNLKDNGAADLLRRLANMVDIASKNEYYAEDRKLLIVYLHIAA